MLSIDSLRQVIRAHPGKVLLVAIAAAVYIGFNIWVFYFTRSGGLKTNPVATITEKIKRFGGLRETPSTSLGTSQSPKNASPRSSAVSLTPTPTPTPTPRPTGPGTYACDPYGQCNLYSDEMRKQYCSITFADSLCLDQCGEKTKQCTK